MKGNHLFRLLAMLVATLGFAEGGQAQLYKTDALLSDSVVFHTVAIRDSAYVSVDDRVLVPNGEKVELVAMTKNLEAVVLYNDLEYAVSPRDLRFGKNAKGVKNTIQDGAEQRRHTLVGHMFFTIYPYVLIFIILVVTGFCMLLVNKFVRSERWTGRLLQAVPCGLLLASLLEVWAYFAIGSAIGWWCDPDTLGIGGSLIMAAPLAIAFSIQVLVGLAYKAYLEKMADVDLTWKSLLAGVGLFLALAIVIEVVLWLLPLSAFWFVFLSVVLLLLALGLCYAFSQRHLSRALGQRLATLFTIFSFFYVIGVVVATFIFFMIALKIILTVLVYLAVIAAGIYLLALAGGFSRKKKADEKKESIGKIEEIPAEGAAEDAKE